VNRLHFIPKNSLEIGPAVLLQSALPKKESARLPLLACPQCIFGVYTPPTIGINNAQKLCLVSERELLSHAQSEWPKNIKNSMQSNTCKPVDKALYLQGKQHITSPKSPPSGKPRGRSKIKPINEAKVGQAVPDKLRPAHIYVSVGLALRA
jgi:hypothetical protein